MARHIFTVFIILMTCVSAAGRDTVAVKSLYHDISAAVSGGYNLPSHGYYRGYNPAGRPLYANSSLHFEYAFGFNPQTRQGSLYRGVTQGIGLSGLTFFDHELMGTPVFAYIFQKARILDFRPGLGFDYKWDLGASYGWQRTEMVGSRTNIYINVGLMLTWDISKSWSVSLGPEFSHCSNGDTCYPNGGANLINLRAAVTGHAVPCHASADRSAINEYETSLRHKNFARRIHYDLVLFGGWRSGKVNDEVYAIINKPFPFCGINFMPMYRLDRHFSVGASLDLIADRSSGIYDIVFDDEKENVLDYKLPPLSRQLAAGLSVRADITMPIFTVGVGAGGFVLGNHSTLSGLYTMFCLKAFVTERLFLNVSYRLSARNYTHNMMYGLGWRFN